jgi:hypothetical protein
MGLLGLKHFRYKGKRLSDRLCGLSLGKGDAEQDPADHMHNENALLRRAR